MHNGLNPDPASATAKRILAAAVEIIDRSGESSLRIAEVMRSAGVQAPMIYRHFGDREGLVQSAHLARAVSALRTDLSALERSGLVVHDARSFELGVMELVAMLADPQFRDGRRIYLEVVGSSVSRPRLQQRIVELREELVARCVGVLRGAQSLGWVRCDLDVVAFVEWQISSTIALASVEHLSPEPDIAAPWVEVHLGATASMLFGPALVPAGDRSD